MSQLVVGFLLQIVVISLVLQIGLHTTPAELRKTWVERRLIVRALLVLELVVPVLALAIVSILPLNPPAAGIIALMAVCPGAPILLRKFDGRSTVIVILAAVSLLAPLTVPIWLAVIGRVLPIELAVRPETLAEIIMVRLILPLLAGMAVAAAWPRVAMGLERIVRVVFWVGLAIALALVLYLGVPVLFQASPWAFLAVIIFVMAAAAVGHFAGGPRMEDRKALASIAVLGNPALALAVASYSVPNPKMTAVVACYLIVRALALLPYGYLVDRWNGARGRSPLIAH